MGKDKITFTKEEVQEMIMVSFVRGELYGLKWGMGKIDQPSKEERECKANEDCEDTYKGALLQFKK